jgi:hypothetical protein
VRAHQHRGGALVATGTMAVDIAKVVDAPGQLQLAQSVDGRVASGTIGVRCRTSTASRVWE